MHPTDSYGLKFCVLGENHESRTQDAGVKTSLLFLPYANNKDTDHPAPSVQSDQRLCCSLPR